MAGKLLSPTSIKLKNINAARKIKNGSPKIREVFRQRCRQRMQERRNELFLKRRLGLTDYSEEVKDALTDIVHEEFDNMEWINTPEQLQSVKGFAYESNTLGDEDETTEIEESIEEQWILEEYQRILWEQKQISSMFVDDVICPICLKDLLQEVSNFVVCNCGFKLPVQGGLQNLKKNIQEQVNAHSAECLDVPKFSIFQEGDNISLCFSCPSCDIFALV